MVSTHLKDYSAVFNMCFLDDIQLEIYDEDEDAEGITRCLNVSACKHVVLPALIKSQTITIANIDTIFCDISDPFIETYLLEWTLNFAKYTRLDYVRLSNETVIKIEHLNNRNTLRASSQARKNANPTCRMCAQREGWEMLLWLLSVHMLLSWIVIMHPTGLLLDGSNAWIHWPVPVGL